MKAVEIMKIKAMIVSTSTDFLIKWPQLIRDKHFQSCDQIFGTSRKFATKHFFLISSPVSYGRSNGTHNWSEWDVLLVNFRKVIKMKLVWNSEAH